MKAIIFSLASIMLLQLSSTMAKPTDIFGKEPQIMPTADKRYPLFNFVVTSLYEQKSLEMVTQTFAHIKMLQAFDSLLESHKDHPGYNAEFQADLKKEIEQFKTLADDLQKDATNCEKKTKLSDFIETSVRKHFGEETEFYNGVETIFEDYQVWLRAFRETFPKTVAKRLHDVKDIQKQMEQEIAKLAEEARTTVMEHMRTFITPFYGHLNEAIEKFIATLDENDKKQYADTMEWCEETLAADTPYKVYRAFYGFNSLLVRNVYLHFGDRDQSVCTWDFKTILGFYDLEYFFLSPKE